MTLVEQSPLDPAKLEQFVFRAVDEVGATLNAALVVIGDQLGLYRALAGAGALTSGELAARTGTRERYVREWLNAQAAGGYVEYDPADRSLQPAARAGGRAHRRRQPGLPARVLPARARLRAGRAADRPRRSAAARGLGWGEHDHRPVPTAPSASSAPATTPTWSSPGCRRSTASSRSCRQGARVADVGLRSRRLDDPDGPGLPELDVRRLRLPRRLDRDRARQRGRGAGVERPRHASRSPRDRLPRRATTTWSPIFDCLHDMGDPVGAARHVRDRSPPTARG